MWSFDFAQELRLLFPERSRRVTPVVSLSNHYCSPSINSGTKILCVSKIPHRKRSPPFMKGRIRPYASLFIIHKKFLFACG